MKIIEFLFYFINQFIQLKPDRLEKLEYESQQWEIKQKAENTKLGSILEKTEVWYIQLGTALFALFAIKLTGDWFYGSGEDTDIPTEIEQPHEAPRQKIKMY
jgi:hypothetical protein